MSNTPVQSAARSTLGQYGSTMASDPTAAAIDATARMTKAERDAEQARRDRDDAVVAMYKGGMNPPSIARALTDGGHKISTSGVRYILRGKGIEV